MSDTNTGGFDLSTLNIGEMAEQPRPLTVLHPVSGQPLMGANGKPTVLYVIGAESNTARELQRRAQRARVKVATAKRMDPEELEVQATRFLAALVKRWENIEWQGAPLECTYENVVMLLTTLGWLRKQVDEFAYDIEEFASGN